MARSSAPIKAPHLPVPGTRGTTSCWLTTAQVFHPHKQTAPDAQPPNPPVPGTRGTGSCWFTTAQLLGHSSLKRAANARLPTCISVQTGGRVKPSRGRLPECVHKRLKASAHPITDGPFGNTASTQQQAPLGRQMCRLPRPPAGTAGSARAPQ